MKREPLILIVIILCITELIGQPGELVQSQVFSTNEGLGHRITLDINSDAQGNFYINSPVGLQRYSKGEINATRQIENLGTNQSMLLIDDLLATLDIDNCIHVVDKSNFNKAKKYCLESYIEGKISLIVLRQNKLLILSKTEKSTYKVTEILPQLNGIKIIHEAMFKSNLEILDFYLSDDRDLMYIDADETFHRLGSDPFVFQASSKAGSLKMPPKIFENKYDNSIYFSGHTKPGVFKITGTKVEQLHEGFIQTYNEDQQGDALIGICESTINFISNLLYLEHNKSPILWNELISNNKKILDFHSTDFSDEITVGSFNGIYQYLINPMHVQSYLSSSEVQHGDFGAVVRCIGKAHNNKINAVKEGGEVVYQISYDSVHIEQSLLNLINRGANWFEYDPIDSSYHFGNYHGDFTSTILEYKVPTKETTKFDFPMTIERFFMDEKYYWVIGNLSESGKVLRIDRASGQQESLFEKDLVRKDVRSCLLLDDLFLVGTINGLLVFERKNNKATEGIIESTENLHITSLRKYENKFFLGTQGDGLKIFSEEFNLLKDVKIGDTRPSNTIAAIERDTFGNYWISTFDGITVLNEDLLLVEKIELEDGLSSSEFNRDASFKDEDGTLYFGNLNGYTRINPALFLNDIDQNEYLIDEVRYNIGSDQYILSQQKNSIDIKGIPDVVQLSYYHPGFSSNSIQPNLIRKDVIIQPNPDSLSIEHDLITLYGLQRGSYDISVTPRYGNKSTQTITNINFSSNYDWLKEVIAISSVIGLISYFISSWIISLVRRESEAKIELQNQLADIRMKALRSQLNPHFIFNSLNSIQYYIQVNDKRKARDYLSKFARLMRMVLQSSHDDVISLDKEIEQLKIYLELEKLRFEDMWDYKLSIDDDIDTNHTTIPSMLFQPIIENAIIHGLGNLKNKEGLLSISVEKNGSGIIANIEDNGVGRTKSLEINNKKVNKSKSLSTSISKDRIALYNKFENEKISIDYTDKYAPSGEATGTIATIKISTSSNGTNQSHHH